jgi:hypothetical protein
MDKISPDKLLAQVQILKVALKRLAEQEEKLKRWEANLEDREQTLRTAFLEFKQLTNGKRDK